MAYIEIHPKSEEALKSLTESCESVMNLLHHSTKKVFEVLDNDIIVELNHCTTVAFNQHALEAAATPDVIVKISTSDQHLQPKFQSLCSQIIQDWDAKFKRNLKVEVWINPIAAWGSNIDFG